jgi:hypothetical protein
MPIEQPITQVATSDAPVNPTMPLIYREFTREEQSLLLTDAPATHLLIGK